MLHFITSVMNSGKTARLLQLNYDFQRIGKKTLLMKPAVDNREKTIKSRNGLESECAIIDTYTDIENVSDIDILFIDEVQFLTDKEVEALRSLTFKGITVYAFGLKTDFKGKMFEGSKRLIELADDIEELSTICLCGEKATMNLKYDKASGKVIKNGRAVECGYEDMYMAVCFKHWKSKNISEIK